MKPFVAWLPAVLLTIGATFTVGVDTQRSLALSRPLGEVIPRAIGDYAGRDVRLSEAELAVAGATDHLLRNYDRPGTDGRLGWVQVYVGYYDRQTQGKTIHSPKNCLPGGGWKPLVSRREMLETSEGTVPVNRYLLQKRDEYALVLYWYQGRGRVEANEYIVKWDLLRDAATRQRSEEALVRVVVPVTEGEPAAFALASRVAAELVPTVYEALPR